METRTELLRGTLDLLILRSLKAAPLHGLGIARRIGLISRETFDVKPGSLFPALYRLEERGFVASVSATDDGGRRIKVYKLTARGHRQLEVEEAQWRRVAAAMTHALEEHS